VIVKQSDMPDGTLRHPYRYLKAFWTAHEQHAIAGSNRPLSRSDIFTLTIFSLLAAFLVTFVDFLIYLRWSTFSTSDPFVTYHPLVPWLLIGFNLIFIYCLWMKRITFWLAYYPSVIAIIYYAIEAALINHWLRPQDLMAFFSMFGLGHPPSWLIGV